MTRDKHWFHRSWRFAAFFCVTVLYACGSDTSTPSQVADAGGEQDASTVTDLPEPDMSADLALEDAGVDMSEAVDETARSGTRLRRRYVSADGASMTLGLYDTELEVACEFREATDGVTRCLPIAAAMRQLVFSDDTCTEPVHAQPVNGLTQLSTACASGWAFDFDQKIYRATETPAVMSGQSWRRLADGTCRPAGFNAEDSHFVAELVSSADFARGTRSDERREGDLVARYYEGDDGSRILHSVLHATLGYECVFSVDGRCVPESESVRPSRSSRYFSNAGCTSPIAGFDSADERPPLIAIRRSSEFCETDVDYYENAGESAPSSVWWQNGSGNCIEQDPGDFTWYRRGEFVPLSSLPQADMDLEGTGSVAARRYRDTQGAPLGPVFEFYDTTNDESCLPFATPSKEVVCVPEDRAVTGYRRFERGVYLEAACTEESALAWRLCDQSTPFALVEEEGPSCEIPGILAINDVYQVGARLPTGATFYSVGEFSSCDAVTVPDDDIRAYWQKGPRSTETLPLLSYTVE